MAQATTTTDHKRIRKWVEDRGGSPATVQETGGDEPGILRIDFPGGAEESLERVSWDDFFDKFDKEQLAFLHQDRTDDGKLSRFCKFVSREG